MAPVVSPRRRRTLPLALALLALGGSLASCSHQRGDQLRLGAGIALTGNAGLLGQDARTGLDLARQQFAKQAPGLELQLEDTGSDETGATVAFRRLKIGRAHV